MIDITEVMQKTSSIYDFYKLGEEGLKHPDILAKEVSRKIKFLQDFTKQPMTEKFFKDGKVPPEEFFASQSMVTVLTKTTQETIKAGVNYLRKQTVVLFHSYIEIIISNIVRMILQREVNILKGIYSEKSKLPFIA